MEEQELLDYQVVRPEIYKKLKRGAVRLLTETPRLVGYWAFPEHQHYDNEVIYTDGFRLPHPRDSVDTYWDSEERQKVIHYLEAGSSWIGYLGYSYCRMGCAGDPEEMGNHEFTDGVWIYPEGYSHYLKVHNVKPPEEFLKHIRKNRYKQPNLEKRDRQYNEAFEASIKQLGRKYEEEIRKIHEIKKSPKKPWWRFW